MDKALILAGMFVVTFGIRFGFLAAADKIDLPEWLKEALHFIPPCVLTAIIVPSILLDDSGSLFLSFENRFLVVGSFCVLLSLWKENLLLSIAGSMSLYMAWLYWVPLN